MKNFFTRTFTGILFVILVLSSVIVSHYFFAAVFLVITFICLTEYYTLIKSENIIPARILATSIGLLLFLSFTLASFEIIGYRYLYLNIPLILLLFVVELFSKRNNHFGNISYSITGIFYIALPLSLLNFYYDPHFIVGENNNLILLGFFVLVWIHDVGAYVAGSVFGRHKLFERISPNKSWEGSIVGGLLCLVCAYFLGDILGELSALKWIIMAFIIVLSGTFGDLVESMLKRDLKVKDSGSLMPGHGGVLDRFDAVLFASPTVFVYLLLIS